MKMIPYRKITALLLTAAFLVLSGFTGRDPLWADISPALSASYNADPYYAAYTSEVEDQKGTNYCWAYMANAVLESYLMKNNALSQIDFSESNMISQLSGGSYGFSSLSAGGSYHQALAYWTRGVQYGPRLEPNDSRTDYYVSETTELGRYDITDARSKQNYIQNIKNLIVRYGAVGVSIYFNENGRQLTTSQGAYYFPEDDSPGVNHGVTIVGWNDSFPAQSFGNLMASRQRPQNNGAFLVKNSWGKYDASSIGGNTGYYWISYENYFQDAFAVTNVVQRSSLYDYVYETDYRGFGEYAPGTSYSQLYQLSSPLQRFSGFATYVKAGAHYRFFVNGRELTQFTGTMAHSGYHTFQLAEPILLGGTVLELRAEVTSTEYAVPVAAGAAAGTADAGNACLKVFTKLTANNSGSSGSSGGTTTVNPSTVTQVVLSPQESTLRRGANQTFSAYVLGTGQPSQQIDWLVSGSSSSNTKIVNGTLYVGPDETSGVLYVYANAHADNTKSAAARVTIADSSTQTPGTGGSTTTPGTGGSTDTPGTGSGTDTSPESGAPKVTTLNKGIYTCLPDHTASYTKCIAKTHFSVSIPATVKIGSRIYEVTALDNGCMQKNKKILTVTIGKNVAEIGEDAFRGCSKLKKVKITSIALESIGKDAFQNISSKAVVYVPRSRLSDYRTMIRDSGNKTVQVKAYN